jgi:glutamine synthetase
MSDKMKRISHLLTHIQPDATEASPKPSSFDGFASCLFTGAVAAKYLANQGLQLKDLTDSSWVRDPAKADKIAAAVLEWAVSMGATTFCHWFQPMAATFRHGQSGQVQDAFFEFDTNMVPVWKLRGKDLLQGETDGSSYPNGGMRATHSAGAYLTIDPKSPIFLRDDAIFIPACFVSYKGEALDEKTPLHRATSALSKQGQRLFSQMGFDIDGLVCNIGLEQEVFFVPRDQFYRRQDLQFTGRTVMGRMPARGQEGSDHYMAPINVHGPVMACMQEIQAQCYKLGIPLRTRHREVAPGQYEFAPLFGSVWSQIDQNLMAMQIVDEVAAKHGLAALFQEKPFQGVNGSGKHNNWSVSTLCGAQLLNPEDLTDKSNNPDLFPLVMACIVSAIDKYGDLMRMAIAAPGNDFRLGAMEAPPSVISTYLGKQMTEYLKAYRDGKCITEGYQPKTTPISLGVDYLPTIHAPAEDRNRTSPFPYGGHRFEFRAVGSSQNVSLVNTVLCTMCAEQFKIAADMIESQGMSPVAVTQSLLKKHWRIIFNGNGYDPSWPARADDLGLFHIDSSVEAICQFTAQKNIDLFSGNGVFSAEECFARKEIMLEAYIGTVETECLSMISMMKEHVIPATRNATGLEDLVAQLTRDVAKLEGALSAIHGTESTEERARACRTLRLELMIEVREGCDTAETHVPAEMWTLATYKELLFIDTHARSVE